MNEYQTLITGYLQVISTGVWVISLASVVLGVSAVLTFLRLLGGRQ